MNPRSADEALTFLGRKDPAFNPEIRRILAPVKDRFFAPPIKVPNLPVDGLSSAPPFLTDPELRRVAIELAEYALGRGLDANVEWDEEGNTFLHYCVMIRDSVVACESVAWLLAHGADPNVTRRDGQSPFRLAVRHGRTELETLMRAHGVRG